MKLHVFLLVLLGGSSGSVVQALLPVPTPRPATLSKTAVGMSMSVYADTNLVQSPVSMCFDRFGRMYVVDSGRRNRGVEDSRKHPFWVLDDLSIQTLEDREAMYKKWIGLGRFEPDWFTRHADTVVRLEDSDGDGKADDRNVFATFRHALDGNASGILWRDGKVYLGCSPALWELQDRKGDGHAENRRILIDGLGLRVGVGGHDLRGLEWGPDGKLYFAIGDRGYRVTTRDGKSYVDLESGAVFRCDSDGRNLELLARGFRNPRDLAFDAFGNLFLLENRYPSGSALYHIRWGMDAGWRVGFENQAVFGDLLGIKAGVWPSIEKPWTGEGPRATVRALTTFDGKAHGIMFDPRTQKAVVSGGTRGLLVFSITRAKGSFRVGLPQPLIQGGDIVAAESGLDGSLYVADRQTGKILRLRAAIQDPASDLRDLFLDGFERVDMTGLGELLGHPDYRVRQAAQFELVSRGRKSAQVFADALMQKKNRFRRLHAIHGIGMLEGVEPGVTGRLFAYLKDDDAMVRALCARAIGKAGNQRGLSQLQGLLNDSDPVVLSDAMRALGRLGDVKVMLSVLNSDKSSVEPMVAQAGIAYAAMLPEEVWPDDLVYQRHNMSCSGNMAA